MDKLVYTNIKRLTPRIQFVDSLTHSHFVLQGMHAAASGRTPLKEIMQSTQECLTSPTQSRQIQQTHTDSIIPLLFALCHTSPLPQCPKCGHLLSSHPKSTACNSVLSGGAAKCIFAYIGDLHLCPCILEAVLY